MSDQEREPGYSAGWCIHYRYNRDKKPGDQNTCKAGVDFDRFREVKFDHRPCFLDAKTGARKPGAVFCEKLRCPTPDEISANDVWVEVRMNLPGKVMTGIRPWRAAHKGRSAREIVECPACAGKLHLSISAYNGHVHGHCETDGCVSWME